LLKAKEMSRNSVRVGATQTTHTTGSTHTSEPEKSKPDTEKYPEADMLVEGGDINEKSGGNYKTFLTLLYGLLDNYIDVSSFEDNCRDLFGTQAFTLFTLDKVIIQITKQALHSCETCSNLLTLYSYERKRQGGFVEATYLANCLSLLGDETCYRFEQLIDEDSCMELTMQLLDQSQLSNASDNDKRNTTFEGSPNNVSSSYPESSRHTFLTS